MSTTIIVMAKSPIAGRAKTRLCPPCTSEESASLARAALIDTLTAAVNSEADRVVVCLRGAQDDWLIGRTEVIEQRGDSFAQRLSNAFVDVDQPAILIGMDTPQVTATVLNHAIQEFNAPKVQAAFGPASDGGFWLLGLHQADPRAILGVRMSQPDTGQQQLERLKSLGLWVAELQEMTDVDTFDDALAVALAAPRTRFATTVRELRSSWRPGDPRREAVQ